VVTGLVTDYRITYSMRESVTTSTDNERLTNQVQVQAKAKAKSKLKLGTPRKYSMGDDLCFRISNEGTGFFAVRYNIDKKEEK
jgi:hypothetical protein